MNFTKVDLGRRKKSMSLEYLMGRWHPQIGDPSFMGWFTVGSYFGCAIFGAIIVLINRKADKEFLFFWSMISLLMILLGINKQLDLQSLFTEVGRQIARAENWMDRRQVVQFWFIVAFGTTSMVAFLLFVMIKRDLFRRFMLAFMGLFFLLSFIIIRASSFHHFEEMLGFELFELKMNWLLELTGIYLIFVAEFKEIFIELVLLRKISSR
jgi:hypothetical protein